MPWFLVDDHLAMHPKVVESGNAAMGLWVRAGSWCSAHLTEGRFPYSMVTALGGHRRDARKLVDTGLWRQLDGSKGDYVFHEWDQRNKSKDQVEAEREATRKRVANHRSGTSSAQVGHQLGTSSAPVGHRSDMKVVSGNQLYAETESADVQVGGGLFDSCNAVTSPVTNGVTNAALSLPIPSLKKEDVPGKPKKRAGDTSEFVRFWAAYPRRADKGNARTAFAKALKIADVDVIISGAERYRDSPQRNPNYTRLPSTWLNGEGWEDEVIGPPSLPAGERKWEE
jgi:hypothetical protein